MVLRPDGADAEVAQANLVEEPNDLRLFALFHALRQGEDPASLAARSHVNVWFLERIQALLQVVNGEA